MKNILKLLVALALIIEVRAQTPTNPPPTTARALVLEALTQNPELRFYEAELSAARAQRKTAGRLAQPEFSGEIGHMESRSLGGQMAGDGVAWSVGVSQSFEWPGRLGLRKAIANADMTLAELGLARFRSALAARLRGQIYTWTAANEKARVARDVAERYRLLRDVLVLRDPAGATPELELRILEATEIGLRRRATQSELRAQAARLAINQLLGRWVDNPLTTRWSEPELRPAPQVDALIAAARTNNFDLRLRLVELEQQGFRVDLTRNEAWPAFKVGPQFTEENATSRDRIAGLAVSFPLPLWRNNTANVEAARARRIQAETLLNTTRRDVERRVVSALRNYETQLQELSKWRSDSVNHFAEAAQLADQHYRLAALPATTYLEIQKQYLEAVETLFDTQLEAIAAAAELEELTGIPLTDRP